MDERLNRDMGAGGEISSSGPPAGLAKPLRFADPSRATRDTCVCNSFSGIEIVLPLWGMAVTDPFPTRVSAALARKGHDLAVQREAYYRELLESGRWKHYGAEADIKTKLAEAEAELKRWRDIIAKDVSSPAVDEGAALDKD